MDKRFGITLVVAALVFSLIFLLTATIRDLTALENVLFQIYSLGLGLIGSYVIGRESSREAAKAVVKPHARSAFRCLLSLYKSLSRLANTIQNMKSNDLSNIQVNQVLERLEGIVTEQIATADDALEDWRDIVPEELAELQAQLAPINTMGKER